MADHNENQRHPVALSLAGITSAGVGMNLLNKAAPKVSGIENYYHATGSEGIKKQIQQEGILASHAAEPGSLTQQAGVLNVIPQEQLKGKTYVTKDQNFASVILNNTHEKPAVVDVKIPYTDLENGTVKRTLNPELRGMDKEEFVNTRKAEPILQFMFNNNAQREAIHKKEYDLLAEPSTLTIEGDVPTKYIKGGANYTGQTGRGVLEYAKAHPKRFASGLGVGSLGLAGLAGAGMLADTAFSHQKKEASEEFITIQKGNNDEKYSRLLKRLRERRNPPTLLLAADEPIAKEAASFGARHAIPIALSVPLALATWKTIHSAIIAGEPRQDIRTPLAELASRKEKTQAVRTAFEDRFNKLGLKDVDDEKTKIQVGRSMFPWKDAYSVDVDLKDRQGESVGEWPGYSAKVFKDKDGAYTGLLDMIFTKEPMQGKGIGTAVESKMVDAFRDVGATKARLLPAFDGPLVWAKEKFNYRLSPNSKSVFLKAYKAYAKEKGIPFKDLGDKPSDYPEDFLKALRDYEPTFRNSYYEKEIKGPLAKEAASFDARRNKQYWQLLKRLYGGNDEAVEAIKETRDPGIYHGTRQEMLPSVLSKGLKAGPFREFGMGTFFGSRHIAELYGNDFVTHNGMKAGNVWDEEGFKSISDPKEMIDYARNNPDSGYEISLGGISRLAKPSELHGTKTLYPTVTKAKVFDISDNQTLHDVAPSQTYAIADHDKTITRAKSLIHQRMIAGPEEKALGIATSANRKQLETNSYSYDNLSPAEQEIEARKGGRSLLESVRNPDDDNMMGRHVFNLRIGELLREKLIKIRNDKELRDLQYYGKLRGRRVFERANPKTKRHEFFFDQTNIPPELIRQAAQIFLGIEKEG
jgi:GNAT superfamily N-acetyltransferase